MHAKAAGTSVGTYGIATLYQFGRVSGYAIAGAICGFIGSQASALFELIRLGSILRIASGVLIALLGVRLLWQWNALAWLERLGAKFWIRLRPLVQLAGTRTGIAKPLAMGLLWSLLPCGLVYSMLMFAAMSADPARGALIMLAFGLGTLPSMLTASLLAARIQNYLSRPAARIASGTLMLGFGVWMIVAAVSMGGAAHAHH
jgi:sulfite exporter TauE/SafE